jgi:hypothetical protein
MTALSSLWNRYLGCTMAYGLAHAVPFVWSYKTSLYRKHYNDPLRELLLVDKVGLVFATTVTAPILWPFLLREDMIRLECFACGKPVSDYIPPESD